MHTDTHHQAMVTSTAALVVDHEGKTVTVQSNGDATRYGAFLEADAGHHEPGGPVVTVHLTPEAMRELGAWLLGAAGSGPFRAQGSAQ